MSKYAKNGMVFWNDLGIVHVPMTGTDDANLNLITPSYRSGFEPGYSKSTSEVHKEVSIHELGENKVRTSVLGSRFHRLGICEVIWDFSSSSVSRAHAVV